MTLHKIPSEAKRKAARRNWAKYTIKGMRQLLDKLEYMCYDELYGGELIYIRGIGRVMSIMLAQWKPKGPTI
jgi:hypothetical protein